MRDGLQGILLSKVQSLQYQLGQYQSLADSQAITSKALMHGLMHQREAMGTMSMLTNSPIMFRSSQVHVQEPFSDTE